ncbi:hypothetical protein CBER1_10507 [Cercospora berteroae]|uniref:Uncharacterized protein n=1 Tax=Cercospora berteroae TaxID=357750 RepID=A0A2S6BYE8_9PEZI|nr:hypothetical protein CBER1_10507 [Cercospora berteroae]
MSNSFSDSPTVVLPPPAPNSYFANSHYVQQHDSNAHMLNGISPTGLANANAFKSNGTTPGSIAGRKRSRGDIFSQDDEDEEHLEDGSTVTPGNDGGPVKPRGKPVYGPGMTLVYPDEPYENCAESQSGTWKEELDARRPFALAHSKRPSVTSRKSQRLDSRAAGPDDLAQLVLPPTMRDVTNEPLIDEVTRRLGISWTRMDTSEARQINQRAYSKWISNHYPQLNDVSIWFENSSIPGYLVAALNAYNGQHEYYIFSEDLTEARLVTTDPSQLIPRLQMLPALHLAAPGGCIRAETDPITADQNEVTSAMVDSLQAYSHPNGCAAHAMELD